MIPQPALADLMLLNERPSLQNAARLIKIPAIYNALQYEKKGGGDYSEALLTVCLWLESRTFEVLALLTLGRTMPESFPAGGDTSDWRKVI